jgi:hypothetical protein
MIIWDYDNQEHIIRINGIERDRLRASDIAGNIIQIERKVKLRVDGVIIPLGYHFFLHIFSKIPIRYVIWIGSIGIEPHGTSGHEWWDNPDG